MQFSAVTDAAGINSLKFSALEADLTNHSASLLSPLQFQGSVLSICIHRSIFRNAQVTEDQAKGNLLKLLTSSPVVRRHVTGRVFSQSLTLSLSAVLLIRRS